MYSNLLFRDPKCVSGKAKDDSEDDDTKSPCLWRVTSHRANCIEPRKMRLPALQKDSHRGLIRVD